MFERFIRCQKAIGGSGKHKEEYKTLDSFLTCEAEIEIQLDVDVKVCMANTVHLATTVVKLHHNPLGDEASVL